METFTSNDANAVLNQLPNPALQREEDIQQYSLDHQTSSDYEVDSPFTFFNMF